MNAPSELRRAVDASLEMMPNTRAWAEHLVVAFERLPRGVARTALRAIAAHLLEAADRLDANEEAEALAIEQARRIVAATVAEARS